MTRVAWFICLLLLAPPVWAQASANTNSTATSGAGATATNQPVQSMTLNSTVPSHTEVRTAPAIFAPSMNPTTPCTSVLNGGVSVVGFGMTLGTGLEDKECTRREFARVLAQMGFPDAGLAMLCGNEEVRRTSPQLCSRSDYVSKTSESYVGSEPPVMPPAKVIPSKPMPPPGPAIGQVGFDPNGARMVYTGVGWVPETAAAAVVSQPLRTQ